MRGRGNIYDVFNLGFAPFKSQQVKVCAHLAEYHLNDENVSKVILKSFLLSGVKVKYLDRYFLLMEMGSVPLNAFIACFTQLTCTVPKCHEVITLN